MNLADLMGDKETIRKMSDQDFSAWWDCLGTVVRLAALAGMPAGERKELNCTAASTERRWSTDVTYNRGGSKFGIQAT